MKSFIAFCILITSSIACASDSLESVGHAFMKCEDNYGREVKVYSHANGLLGIKVIDREYLIAKHVDGLTLPIAQIQELSQSDESQGLRIHFQNEFNISIRFKAGPYRTTLTYFGWRFPLMCQNSEG